MRTIFCLLILVTFVAPASAQTGSQSVARGNNQFAIDFYRQVADGKDGNIFFSPYSISAATAILYLGARGQTAEEMRTVLHLPEQDNEVHNGFSRLTKTLLSRAQGDTIQLRIANALWVDGAMEIEQRFLTHSHRFYDAGVQSARFQEVPERERVRINEWVEDQTNDRIKDLLPRGSITSETRLVITNAVYFLALWESAFDEGMTQEGTFHLAGGSDIEAKLMHQTRGFGYTERDAFQLAILPYKKPELVMAVFLPRGGHDLTGLTSLLDADSLTAWIEGASMNQRRVDLKLPRFTFSWETSLKKPMSALGMRTAFTYGADLSGMAPGLFVQDGFHKAFVEVTESGTEAAAATAWAVGITSAGPQTTPPVEFHADHPFLFLIYDREAHVILFMGRVMQPPEE